MIKTIGIIGGGKMGNDIFHFLSNFPFQLIWFFKTRESLEKSQGNWFKKQQRALKFNQITEEVWNEKLKLVQFTTDISSLCACDLIIESITENLEMKKQLFRKLDAIVQPDAVFSSNTSSFPIRSLVPSNLRIEHFIGLHFFYPMRMKNLVEVNVLQETNKATLERVTRFLMSIGKFFIPLHEPDHFLFNRMFLQLQAGVYRIHEDNKIPIETLDSLIKEKLFPIGIFEFFDQVGIDVMYTSVHNYTFSKPDADFFQPLLNGLKKLININHLGVKTGCGFYDYANKNLNNDPNLIEVLDSISQEKILKKIYVWYLSSIFEVVNNRLLTRPETEHIVGEYMGVTRSPFELAKEISYNHKK
jgi:3-hydroxybutyryl-CoA dehydrogenase